MQLIITDAWLPKNRVTHLSGTKLGLTVLLALFILMLMAAGRELQRQQLAELTTQPIPPS